MYIYYNPNPRGKRIAGDCVIRALCKAFEAPWQDIYAALSVQGYMMGDWGNSDPVWGSYLRSKGFIRYTLPSSCPDCYTIQDFAMGVILAINPKLYDATIEDIEKQ